MHGQLELSIESAGEEQRAARIVRNAERFCFVEQTIVTAPPVKLCVFHNGNELEVGADAGAEG